jgi:hypothetical protein
MLTRCTPHCCRSGVGAPVITSCEGGYHHDSRKSRLEWQLPHVDDSNKSGQLEFSIKGHPSDFFPVTVTFTSTSAYCDIEVLCCIIFIFCVVIVLFYSIESLFFDKCFTGIN